MPAVSDTGEQRSTEDEQIAPLAWLRSRAGLVILVLIAAIVAWRLLASWIKWLLIAVIVGAVFYLLKSRPRDQSEHD